MMLSAAFSLINHHKNRVANVVNPGTTCGRLFSSLVNTPISTALGSGSFQASTTPLPTPTLSVISSIAPAPKRKGIQINRRKQTVSAPLPSPVNVHGSGHDSDTSAVAASSTHVSSYAAYAANAQFNTIVAKCNL